MTLSWGIRAGTAWQSDNAVRTYSGESELTSLCRMSLLSHLHFTQYLFPLAAKILQLQQCCSCKSAAVTTLTSIATHVSIQFMMCSLKLKHTVLVSIAILSSLLQLKWSFFDNHSNCYWNISLFKRQNVTDGATFQFKFPFQLGWSDLLCLYCHRRFKCVMGVYIRPI